LPLATIILLFFFFLFPIDEKETKNLDKKELQRARPTLARIFVVPHARQIMGIYFQL
jgi:hypothetical protein